MINIFTIRVQRYEKKSKKGDKERVLLLRIVQYVAKIFEIGIFCRNFAPDLRNKMNL